MNSIDNFHFLRPEWFFALIPLALLVLALLRINKTQSGWQSVLPAHLYRFVISSKGGEQSRPPFALLFFGWIIAVTALAGPAWEKLPQPVYQLSAGKVVVMDMSLSMRATDIKPDRLSRAKFKALDLINAISEGDVGLVAYAGDAFRISPLTEDVQNLTTLLPSLSPEIMPVAGSDPLLGIEMAADLLRDAGYFEGEIFWITDGIEMSQVAELNNLLSLLPYRISILGVGTPEGAPIQLTDGDFLKDTRGAIVVPKMMPDQLAALARKSGGKYATITPDDTDISILVKQELVQREIEDEADNEEKFGDEFKEAGPYLLLLLLPFAAFAFRRGYLTALVCVGLLSGLIPQHAHAVEWRNWFKNDDQQAVDAFTNEEFEAAAAQFDDPMWRGSAWYRQGDFEKALAAYSEIASPQAWYNQGNALAQLGKLDEAISAYDKVLQAEPDHQQAAENKALLEKLKEQQQNQQDQSQSQDQQEQQQNQDQQNQQSDQQQSQSQQDSQQQGEQNQQQDPSEQQSQQQADQKTSEEQSQDQQQQEQAQAQEQENTEESENATEQQNQQQLQQAEQPQEPLSDEEREQMQRMQNLLNKVPDDPAYLLKRKMMLENQQRRRDHAPSQSKRTW